LAISFEIRHSMAGRIRLFVPEAKENAFAMALKSWIENEPRVSSVRVNPTCGAVVVSFQGLDEAVMVQRLRRRLHHSKTEILAQREACAPVERGSLRDSSGAGWSDWLMPRGWPALALTSSAMVLCMAETPWTAPLAFFLNAVNAIPIASRAAGAVVGEGRLNVDVLDALAIAISTAQGQWLTTAFMIWLINLGDWIRDQTAARSKHAVTRLLDYQEHNAWIVRGGEKVEVPVKQIAAGDIVAVYSGDLIPVDGTVTSGAAAVDQRSITGESLPVVRKNGDQVYATSVVHEGELYLAASHAARDSLAAQIVRMVEEAPVGETRIQNYAEKFADRLVMPTLALGSGLYLLTRDLNRALSTFIVDFGTGIRVAAPTAVLAAMAAAVHAGVLFRGGRHMENLSRVDTVVFDKTGTLTEGRPRILEIISYNGFPPRQVLELAAAAEIRFKHPVAAATVARARESGIAIPERSESKYLVGRGVEARVNGYYLHLGSERFLRDNHIALPAGARVQEASARQGSSLLLAVDGELVGRLVYRDEIRAESPRTLRALRQRRIRELIMLTGDNQATARAVAKNLGMDRTYAEILPHEKADVIGELQRQGKVVAMVGDGINDAPALTYADVGIAMRNGVDIAQQAADVVLVRDNLGGIVSAVDLSRETIRLVHENYAIVAGLNGLALVAALGGLIAPQLTALISNGSAVIAGLNGLRPLLRQPSRRQMGFEDPPEA
jgi:heavy metal translocating P-type ATPase